MRPIPSPRGLPLLGHALAMKRDPLGFMVGNMNRYGGLVQIAVGSRRIYVVADPEIAHTLLHKSHRALTKGTKGMRLLSNIVGQGLLTSDGDLWRRQRRIAQPAFHKQRLAGFATTMVEVAHECATRWVEAAERGTPIDVNRDMLAATLSIVSRTLLGRDLSRDAAEVAHALDFLLIDTRRRMTSPWALPMSWATPTNRRFARAVASIDALLERVIDERVRGAVRGDDLLQMLVDAVDADTGERMNAKQLRDEVVTMFIAGHETTAAALAWTFDALARHPPVRDRLWEELDRVVGHRPPTLQDLASLPWLGQVLDESLRLSPPAWLFARQTSEAIDVGDMTIPADVSVLFCPYAIHRNPRYWADPLAFDPDRFAPERVAGHHALQFIPFGSANRMCIGAGFAVMEAKLVLATLAQRFRWELVSSAPTVPLAAVTLRPRDGVIVRLSARRPLSSGDPTHGQSA